MFLITTTGTLSPVVINDLGGKVISYPGSVDLSQFYSIEELVKSQDLISLIDAGHITVTDDEGNIYTSSADLVNFTEPHSLRSHSDVVVDPNTLSDKNVLSYNQTTNQWESKDIASAGIANAVHTHDGADIVSGIIPDARISQSAVTQYQNQIDHNQLLNYDINEHRKIDDLTAGATNLWSGQKIKAEIDAVLAGAQRRKKVIDIVDPTQPAPTTPNVGDRYILDGSIAGAVDPSWGSAQKNDIVEWDGTQWATSTPAVGWIVYVDLKNRDYAFVDDGTQHWEARNLATQSNLDDLADVVITSPADDEVVAFDNATGKFINQTRVEANIADRVHQHLSADITDIQTTISNNADVAANTAKRHDPLTLGGVAGDTTDDTLDLTGQVLTVNPVTPTTDGAMTAADKAKLDGIQANAEVNAATNIGTAGVGVYKDKVTGQLRFKKLNPASAKITVTDDIVNDKIDFDFGSVFLQDLQDVAALSPIQGDTLVYNGTQFINLLAPGFILNASRNSIVNNIWLRKFGDLNLNQNPFVLPFNSHVIAMVATTRNPETWTAEVYIDANIVSPPDSNNALITLSMTNQDSLYAVYSTPVFLPAGTKLGIYCNGSNIDRPAVELYLRRAS